MTVETKDTDYVDDAYDYPLIIRFYNAPVTSPADLKEVIELVPKWVARWRRIFDYTLQIDDYGIMKPKACGNSYKAMNMPWDWIEGYSYKSRSYEFPGNRGP